LRHAIPAIPALQADRIFWLMWYSNGLLEAIIVGG
jgi:hypothetical protein